MNKIHEMHDAAQATTPVADALANLDVSYPDGRLSALEDVADAVRAELARPAPSAGELAAEAEQAARTIAPPVPGVTRNADFTVFAVLPGESSSSWYVAAEHIGYRYGRFVTWLAYSDSDGLLHYAHGNTFEGPGEPARHHRARALADLARRAGIAINEPPF